MGKVYTMYRDVLFVVCYLCVLVLGVKSLEVHGTIRFFTLPPFFKANNLIWTSLFRVIDITNQNLRIDIQTFERKTDWLEWINPVNFLIFFFKLFFFYLRLFQFLNLRSKISRFCKRRRALLVSLNVSIYPKTCCSIIFSGDMLMLCMRILVIFIIAAIEKF